MVTLSKIYTRTGDSGETSLGNGDRVSKANPRIAAFGDVDELNAVLGLLQSQAGEFAGREQISQIQNELFDLGADLSIPFDANEKPGSRVRLQAECATRLEKQMAELNAELQPLNSFVLPGGSVAASWLHLARTIARRAERAIVALAETESVNPAVTIYLNRLSDYFFVLSRYVNNKGENDVLWQPGKSAK